ncbi:ATP-binding protein [Brevibacillus dissolubilis]|uniref:ATP-binding protein n=1 Tax=Brevibacillus dissolubilis TaxID=1844116 RepID=UPI00111774A3|nr:ATP-binding protein [Brevibacillus dissolubilis]
MIKHMTIFKTRKIALIFLAAVLILFALTATNVVVSYISTKQTVELSIANQAMQTAKSIAESMDQETYRRFLKNPVRNEEYWHIRDYLNDARGKIGALYVYTLRIDNPKLSHAMVVGLPREVAGYPINEPCTVPEAQVRAAYAGKPFLTGMIEDPKYGGYLTAGAPILADNGEILGFVAIDMDVKMVDEVGRQVIRSSFATFVFNGLFVLALFVIFALLHNWYQKELKHAVGETERAYQQELRSILTSVKSIHHDFANHMQVLYGLLELKYYEKALQYLKSLMKEVKIADLSLRVDNPALLVLLQTKWMTAQKKQIECLFDVSNDSFEEVKSADLIRILSNLIDNAMDATLEMPTNERFIKVVCRKQNEEYQIVVENTGRPIPPDRRELIFQSGYSTKKQTNGKSRGIGLEIVLNTLRSYRGTIQVKSDEKRTHFDIRIPV